MTNYECKGCGVAIFEDSAMHHTCSNSRALRDELAKAVIAAQVVRVGLTAITDEHAFHA